MHLRDFFQEESQFQTLVRPVCRCEVCMWKYTQTLL